MNRSSQVHFLRHLILQSTKFLEQFSCDFGGIHAKIGEDSNHLLGIFEGKSNPTI